MAKKKQKKSTPGAAFNAFIRRSAWFGLLVSGMLMVYSIAVDDSGSPSSKTPAPKPFFSQIWESKKPEMDEAGSEDTSTDSTSSTSSSDYGTDTNDDGYSDGTDPQSDGNSDGTDPSNYGNSDGSDPSNYGNSDGNDPSNYGNSDGTDPSNYGNSDGSDPSNYGNSDGNDPSNYGNSDGSDPSNYGNSDGNDPSNYGNSDGNDPSNYGNSDGTDPSNYGNSDGTDPSNYGNSDGNDPQSYGNSDGNDPSNYGNSNGTDPSNYGNSDGTDPSNYGNSDGNDPSNYGNSDGNDPSNYGNSDGNDPSNYGNSDGSDPSNYGNSDGNDPSNYGISDGTDPQSYGNSNGTDPQSYGNSYTSASAESPDPETALAKDSGDDPPPVDPLAFLNDPNRQTEPLIHDNTVTRGPNSSPRYGEVLIQEPNPNPLKSPTGPMFTNFLEIFDFSITPEWVEERWSCIQPVGPMTTRGYRVAVSTGPEISDLVGSLTYYFDNKLDLVKINFEGYTGELDRLLQTMKYFHFSRQVTNDPNAILYASEINSQGHRSFLKTYHRLKPVDTKDPRKKFWITMELCAPER